MVSLEDQNLKHQRFSPMFSSRSLIVLVLIFWSSIHFTYDMVEIQLHSFVYRYPVEPAPLAEETTLSLLKDQLLSKIYWPQKLGLISGLSILVQWSISVSLCQYHTVLITVALQEVLKFRSMSPPTLIFFFNIVLAIQGLL